MTMKGILASWVALTGPLALAAAQGAPASAGPPVTITLGPRHGHGTPNRQGFAHTGGGNIDVAQPSPNTVVITMTGVCVAGGHPVRNSVAMINFDLNQEFEVAFDSPAVKKAKLTIEGRVIGLLRSHKCGKGTAQEGPACAAVVCGPLETVSVQLPEHAVAGGENLSINDHAGPNAGPITAGKYTLHQTVAITAAHPRCLLPCKAASAEFAPDPALDPLWISYWEPFHGANKKDFGFQIVLTVAPDTDAAPPKGK
jgi:hypothetical protein